MRWMAAMCTHTSVVLSKDYEALLNRRHRPNHASVRSTTHLHGSNSMGTPFRHRTDFCCHTVIHPNTSLKGSQ